VQGLDNHEEGELMVATGPRHPFGDWRDPVPDEFKRRRIMH
jgi:hypothetical protein